MSADPMASNAFHLAAPLVLVLLLVALRWRSIWRGRPVRIERLWLLPTLLGLLTASLFIAVPPVGASLPWLIAAFPLGAIIGWAQGQTVDLAVVPATRHVVQRPTPALVVLVLSLLLARTVLRVEIGATSAQVLTDVLLAFLLALSVASRVAIGRRARRLIGRPTQAAPRSIGPLDP